MADVFKKKREAPHIPTRNNATITAGGKGFQDTTRIVIDWRWAISMEEIIIEKLRPLPPSTPCHIELLCGSGSDDVNINAHSGPMKMGWHSIHCDWNSGGNSLVQFHTLRQVAVPRASIDR